ncbi:hypothetical protein RSOLAG1IB_02414 [Rhizoctonia solani AG-1 IB]|uniref:CST complex subunit STN1 n=1 Tax=Thanatephorus cucumeris (strain AG1-IB / isolate 7/3/14) TaxID=1108050 RepID=A0A0B7FI83_THACB|nr:hypothetical protein RSOLAG1IB_02414 [Rhizoctonia solani AG-1 IB]
MPINNEPPATDSLTANQVKSYVLRTDAIAPCSVADAHAIPEAIKDLDIYWLGSVPCRNVRLVGLLLEATEYESRSVYLIDDGTDSINCLKKRPVRMSIEEVGEGSSFHRSRGFEVGDIVSIIGKIESYKKTRQIYVSSIDKCVSPDAESQHLLQVLRQHRDVYSQPFTIPPLPAPSTPKKHERFTPQPGYASSMASSPTTVSHSSPIASPKKENPRLRHPSRLRSKDLNENVFRMYLSHVIISTLSVSESTSQDYLPLESISEYTSNSTPKPSRTRADLDSSNKTPTRTARPQIDPFGSPTPKKPIGLVSDESPVPTLGVTLSYLRRVQLLSDLAQRVVDNAAHERDKAMRHAERKARAKYESLQSLTLERSALTSAAASKKSEAPGSRSRSSQAPHRSSSTKVIEASSHASLRSPHLGRSSVGQSSSIPHSNRASDVSRSSTRTKHPITPEETTRRAAYHTKLSELHEEDKKKRTARMKRLFESALRTLVREGELTLFDGPRRRIPLFSSPTEGIQLSPSGIWHDLADTTTNSSVSTASTALTAPSCSDLETISEDDGQSTDMLSDPSDSEDAYVPVTPEVLRPAMLAALRRCIITQRGGVDLKSWAKALRNDGQWSRIPDLVVKETVETLRQEEWVTRVGSEQWDFTRGSWAKSLKLS